MIRIIHEGEALRAACDAARRAGKRVGVIPTMGALHDGHLSLMRSALDHGAELRVATIFVNPLQFAPNEDLNRYPRTLDADLALLEERGVDLVFAPSLEAMLPEGFQTHVQVGSVSESLEGAHRPGHLRGVTTIVAKLLNLVGPSIAIFGRKDFQQWRVIERMVHDLAMPIEIVGAPIVREADGLALSSRNRYLSPEARGRALSLSGGLRSAAHRWEAGVRDAGALLGAVRAEVESRCESVDYVALADAVELRPLEGEITGGVLLVAARVEGTRLIDNLWLGVDPPPPAA